MTADHAVTDVVIEHPARDGHDAPERASQLKSMRHPSRWLPRCTRCGQWIAPPGGEGYGRGEIWCGPCVLRHLQRVASREMR